MTAAREQILVALRKNLPSPSPLPDVAGQWIDYDDLAAQFCAVLAGVGGAGRVVQGDRELAAAVSEIADKLASVKVLSLVPAAASGNVAAEAVGDPHELADVDLAIVPGEFGVAENGAVWVVDHHWRKRASPFLAHHLMIGLPAAALVATMHDAYRRIDEGREPGFGICISGPSKTADIEQSLVIGAHGPRSLHVLLVQ